MSRVLALLMYVAIWALLLGSGYGFPPIVHPTDYRSDSNEYRWHVDPADRDARAGAVYTLYRGDTRVLSKTHAFALRAAAVADDGTLGGFAYVAGPSFRDRGKFVIALVRTDGRAQVLKEEARFHTGVLHTEERPQGLGVFTDSSVLTVRLANADPDPGKEEWWRFRIEEGTKFAEVIPHGPQSDNAHLRAILYARPIKNSGLTLVQWATSDNRFEHDGTRAAVLDSELKPIWSVEFADEFAAFQGERDAALQRRIRDRGSVLENQDARFSIWQASTRERIDYTLIPGQNDSAWTIEEEGRGKHAGPSKAAAYANQPIPPARTLTVLGKIELGVSAAVGPKLGKFNQFVIDNRARFGLFRCGCDVVSAFSLVDANGTKLREIALDFMPVEQASDARVAWIGGDRWLISFHNQVRSRAVFLDMKTGQAQEITGFEAPPITALSADGSGGFVALTQLFADSTMKSSVLAFDATGKLRWRIEGGYGSDSEIFSANDLTVTSDGVVVVLENVSKQLKRFDRNGRALGASDLKRLWGREPNYPSDIAADASGGVIVVDFRGQPEVVRMRADGSVLGEFTPALANGQRFDINGRVQHGPDGQIWTSDGNALYRLDAAGRVAHTVGAAPDAELLGDIAALEVTRAGNIYAVDARTGTVHGFAADGSRTRICRPATGDYDGQLRGPSLTITDSGEIYVERDSDKPDFLHYAADCERLGMESLPFDTITQDWLAQAGSSNRWVVGYEKIFRVDAGGTLLSTIERTAAGRWLQRPGQAAVAPNGALLIASDIVDEDDETVHSQPVIAIYSASGKAVRDIPVPRGFLSWVPMSTDGDRVAFMVSTDAKSEQRSVWVMDTTTTKSFRVANTHTKPDRVYLVHPPTGPELWLFDGKKGIERLELE